MITSAPRFAGLVPPAKTEQQLGISALREGMYEFLEFTNPYKGTASLVIQILAGPIALQFSTDGPLSCHAIGNETPYIELGADIQHRSLTEVSASS